MAKEIWLPVPIKEFSLKYDISSFGRVRSHADGKGCYVTRRVKILTPRITGNGYLNINLHNRQNKGHFYVHRLVAMAFIPNPDNLPEVNHKDENPFNNNVENLEWCTHRDNSIYGTAMERCRGRKPVGQFSLDGKMVAYYDSIVTVNRIKGYNLSRISSCCRNRHTYSHGHSWRFVDELSYKLPKLKKQMRPHEYRVVYKGALAI